MNNTDKQRVIGKIVAINSDRFTIELLTGIDNFNVNGFDDIHYFAQLNSYVIVPYQNYYIVAEVSGVRERDLNLPFTGPTEQFLNKVRTGKFVDVLPFGMLKPKERRNDRYQFEFGVGVYPALYTDALYIKETELDAIFDVNDQKETVCTDPAGHVISCGCTNGRYRTLSIGKSTIFPDYDVKIDIDKFFGGHAAILGNTGSGKSCTIASMLQSLYRLENYSATGSTFVILDVNGEYDQAFSELSGYNDNISVTCFSLGSNIPKGSQKFVLPHWFLNFDEWSLLLQASEKTQQPVLRNALCIAALLEDKKTDMTVLKNHIVAKCCTSIWTASESPVSAGHRIHALLQKYAYGNLSKNLLINLNFSFKYGNFSDGDGQFLEALSEVILEDFEIPMLDVVQFDLKELYTYLDIAILYEESFGNKQIRDYCSSLLTRAKSIAEREDLSFLNAAEVDIETYKRDILGLVKEGKKAVKKKQVIIFDLHGVADEVVEVISCVLSRIIYEAIKQIEPRNSYPVNLVLEEAHRYIGDDPQRAFLKANRIFELIAKEGRKFGMLLLISSQRPSELSKTVLSQCSNFIVHRIQNPEDLSHIRQITPHISETILKRMPSIPIQHALIFGHAVNLPTTFKVNQANPKPKSDNNQISRNWFRPKEHVVYDAR